MPRFLRLEASFVLFLVWESSCHKKQVGVPLPSVPAANHPILSTPTPSAPTSEAPDAPTTTHPEDPTPYQVNKPPQPVPAKKPARSAATPAAAPPVPAPAPPPAATPPALPPKLGDILTPDEQKQYSASIDQSLSLAQASLNAIGGRQLTKDQQAEVEQIRSFMRQAHDTRGSDPAGAKSLAARAAVLARDLAATFH
jgi:hypothetical protein